MKGNGLFSALFVAGNPLNLMGRNSLRSSKNTSNLPINLKPDGAPAEVARTLYRQAPGDCVFANESGSPRVQESVLRRRIRPAASHAGTGKIGRQTLRHTYSTLLRSTGTDVKV